MQHTLISSRTQTKTHRVIDGVRCQDMEQRLLSAEGTKKAEVKLRMWFLGND